MVPPWFNGCCVFYFISRNYRGKSDAVVLASKFILTLPVHKRIYSRTGRISPFFFGKVIRHWFPDSDFAQYIEICSRTT